MMDEMKYPPQMEPIDQQTVSSQHPESHRVDGFLGEPYQPTEANDIKEEKGQKYGPKPEFYIYILSIFLFYQKKKNLPFTNFLKKKIIIIRSTLVLKVDSFSFKFAFDQPCKVQPQHLSPKDDHDLPEIAPPRQSLDIIVYNDFEMNYVWFFFKYSLFLFFFYQIKKNSTLATITYNNNNNNNKRHFFPFIYQHRQKQAVMPSIEGEEWRYLTFEISIIFDQPRSNSESSEATWSHVGHSPHGSRRHSNTASQPEQEQNSNGEVGGPNQGGRRAPNIDLKGSWFVLNIPFKVPDEEQKQLEEHQDNHLVQIKFGANSEVKISIPWICPSDDGDELNVDVRFTPCHISTTLLKRHDTNLYHTFVDTEGFDMQYRWLSPLKWNGLQKHDVLIRLAKPMLPSHKMSRVYFLSNHLDVMSNLATDWFSYWPETTLEYFVPSHMSIRVDAPSCEVITAVNEFNVMHESIPSLDNFDSAMGQIRTDNFMTFGTNAKLKWRGKMELTVEFPSYHWKPTKSEMKVNFKCTSTRVMLDLPTEHPISDIPLPKTRRPMLNTEEEYCLNCPSMGMKIDYIYHNIYYKEHRDSMSIQLEMSKPELKIYGHFLRYYMNFLQNYCGEYREFLMMNEFRDEYFFRNNTKVDKIRKTMNTPGEHSNAFEAIVTLAVTDPTIVLPQFLYGAQEQTPKIKFQEMLLDLRSTD
ncbi:hypothetical protein RFI_21435, partial [Reticulomyxa filosa]